jgi:murein DD-endopeptidase MepM/ murein hydrolase activator NlpD
VTVEPGDILTPGTVIGRGGNTGINACKKEHGQHVHFEIYDARQQRKLNIYELYQLLFEDSD